MGINLNHIGQMLGIGGQEHQSDPSLGLARTTPSQDTGLGPHSLLGAQPIAPPVTPSGSETGDITVSGHAPQRLSPSSMGMPSLPAANPMDPAAIKDQHQQLQQNADLARELYHPGSEFGTHGLLREIIGGGTDIARHLLHMPEKYGQEKWAERAYGMTSQDPNIAAASTQAAMQQSPTLTQSYEQQLVNQANSKDNAEAMQEYRQSQAQTRYTNVISGLGQSLLSANLGADPASAQANYLRMKPAIQAQLDKAYGEGVMPLPEEYDDSVGRQLAGAGFTGSNVQRHQDNVLSTQARREIANGRNLTSVEVANIGADARRYAADQYYRANVNKLAQQGMPVTTSETTTEGGSILHPTKTTSKTVSKGGAAPAPGGASNGGPPAGYINKNGMQFTGQGNWRDPSNWKKAR